MRDTKETLAIELNHIAYHLGQYPQNNAQSEADQSVGGQSPEYLAMLLTQ